MTTRRFVGWVIVLAVVVGIVILSSACSNPGPTPGVTSTVDDAINTTPPETTPHEPVAGTPAPTRTETEPPSAPHNLQATAFSTTQINLTWDAATDNASIVSYVIYRDGVWLAQRDDTAYVDTDLVPDTIYTYTVVAYDESGNSSAPATAVQAHTLASGTAATVVAHIREDCAGYANCFHSLADWQANFGGIDFAGMGCPQGDLVCADLIVAARIDGGWSNPDTSQVLVEGWATDSDRFIRIYTTPSARHNGVWDTEKYRLETVNHSGIVILTPFMRVEGLQIQITVSDEEHRLAGISFQRDHTQISHNIIKGALTGTADSNTGIYAHNSGFVQMTFWNNIIYGFRNNAPYTSNLGIFVRVHDAQIYNNIVYDCDTGIEQNTGVVIARNNIVQNCTDGFSGEFDPASDHNISDIADDAPNATFGGGYAKVLFMNPPGEDFRLSPADTAAKDQGVNLMNDPNLAFTNDVDGDFRPQGAGWDIGADEASSGED